MYILEPTRVSPTVSPFQFRLAFTSPFLLSFLLNSHSCNGLSLYFFPCNFQSLSILILSTFFYLFVLFFFAYISRSCFYLLLCFLSLFLNVYLSVSSLCFFQSISILIFGTVYLSISSLLFLSLASIRPSPLSVYLTLHPRNSLPLCFYPIITQSSSVLILFQQSTSLSLRFSLSVFFLSHPLSSRSASPPSNYLPLRSFALMYPLAFCSGSASVTVASIW